MAILIFLFILIYSYPFSNFFYCPKSCRIYFSWHIKFSIYCLQTQFFKLFSRFLIANFAKNKCIIKF